MPSPVSLSDLHHMHRMAAALVVVDPVYLPLFERVESELAAFEAKGDAISRARAIAARQRVAA
jgi:hypothetical protein